MGNFILGILALILFEIVIIFLGFDYKKGVRNMKLSFKLVIEKDGQTTEEVFETVEALVERKTALEAEVANSNGDQTTPPADAGNPAVA
jgi:hypothetical protein